MLLKLITLLVALAMLWWAQVQSVTKKRQVRQRPCIMRCTTDSDCKRKNGGNGDPEPTASPLPYCGNKK